MHRRNKRRFFAEAIQNLDFEINYLKSERGEKIPDYLIGETVFEIGGVNKSASQFKGFKAKKQIILTHPGVIEEMKRPLFMVGLVEKIKNRQKLANLLHFSKLIYYNVYILTNGFTKM